MRIVLVALLCSLTVGALGQESWDARRQKLGSAEDPYRILVDKVLMKANGWVMEPEHVAEIKEAGFNVVVPRIGADDNARVERVARMAMDQGMFYMPWIRGTRVEKGDPELRCTDATGHYGELAGPNADALWDYWSDRILFYARLSQDVPSVMGVFMDFENYDSAKVGGGMCYTVLYDAPVLKRFAEAKGLSLPDPLPDNRAAWIEEQGQTEAFRDFQVDAWRARARELREAVDEVNPRFQFIVYPASQSLFIKEVVWREWHTERAPLVMAEVETYWRREYELDAALERLRSVMEKTRAMLDDVDPKIRYMAGLDPVVRGANPEFEGKSAVLGAEMTHGYWVFYEGPEYEGTHPDYFAWYKRANDLIAKRDFSLWREPAETPNPLDEQIAQQARKVAGADLIPLNTDPLPPEELERAFTHRPGANYQVLLKKGERLRGELVGLQHAHLTNGSVAVIVTPSGEILGTVRAAAGERTPIDLIAPEDGVYGIAVTCGRAKGRLVLSNRYVCLAGPVARLVGNQPPAFVAPLPGAEQIELRVKGQGAAEHLQVTLKAPDGTVAFSGDTRDAEDSVTVNLLGQAGAERGAWTLELTQAVEDIVVDMHGCEPRLATHPGRLLVSR